MNIKYTENNEQKELAVEVKHIKDEKKYELYVVPYTIIDRGNGMITKKNSPRTDGGFRYTIEKVNRKSQKRIDTLNSILFENQDFILSNFLNNDYQKIINLF
jgi:hypothetical protein